MVRLVGCSPANVEVLLDRPSQPQVLWGEVDWGGDLMLFVLGMESLMEACILLNVSAHIVIVTSVF